MRKFERVVAIVLDSVGCGALPDAERYGDAGANTLGHTAAAVGGLHMPHLGAMGLGNVTEVQGVAPTATPTARWGTMAERSPGKDTTTGHWELAGVVLEEPFAVFPDGFPEEILKPFREFTGRGVLGNIPASGTEIIARLGEEQARTGDWIVYTSADSVFQVAAHEELIPLDELDRACRFARELLDRYHVGRIISRPYVGTPGNYTRTYNRHDYSMVPPIPTLLDRLQAASVPVVGIGKIPSIYADRGVDVSVHTSGNADGIERTIAALGEHERGLIFTNLVDFDMAYGHRRNPQGYARALEEFDAAVPRLLEAMGPNTLLALTADHGCDPTYDAHTDHTRERVPVLLYADGLEGGAVGERETFADFGQTIAGVLGIEPLPAGTAII